MLLVWHRVCSSYERYFSTVNLKMTVKLIKRTELVDDREKREEKPSPRQLVLTAQGWVEEFKARKKVARRSLEVLMRQA
jgi:hypothetical protein